MADSAVTYSPYLIAGKLSQDFLLTEEGNDINNIPGGHLLYAAIGMSPWEKHPGLIARIGNNYPAEFLEALEKYGFNTNGIKKLDIPLEHRNFISWFEEEKYNNGKVVSQSVLSRYFHACRPFPKDLLGYNPAWDRNDDISKRTSSTILTRDIPQEYLEARCIHLCPMDYLSHNLLPQAFSGEPRRTITLQSGSGYMQPYCFSAIKSLVNGLSAFITREQYLRSLFAENFRIREIPEMMRVLLDYGAENIIVKKMDGSFIFINRFDRKICHLNIRTAGRFEKIGELSCFCGAFLAGLNETYDYKKAAAYGAARASMLQNDVKPYSNLNVLDMLLREKIRIMENMIED